MRKILFDGKEIASFALDSLPMLIHGQEGSGASLYTICLAAKWFTQGYEILFLCGYPMAEVEFNNEVGTKHEKAMFYTKDKIKEFVSAVEAKATLDNTIVFIKNTDLFDDNILNIINSKNNIIISGDVEKTTFKSKLLAKGFKTEIYFSPLEGRDLLSTQKYQGYVITDGHKGVTSLKD